MSMMSLVIGHRGAAGLEPENSLAGFRRAKEMGCDWVETDASLLKDEHVILHHDSHLKDGRALSALSKRDIGDLDIASLDDLLSLSLELGLNLNIELKCHLGGALDEDRRLAYQVAKALGARDHLPDIVISSFSINALTHFRHFSKNMALGLLCPKWSAVFLEQASSLQARAIHLSQKGASSEAISSIRQSGLEIYVYTVNDVQRGRDLWQKGVDGIFTDYPNHFLPLASQKSFMK